MDILAGYHNMIVTIRTYGCWSALMKQHQIEGGVVIYQGVNMRWKWISNVAIPEEIYPPTWISMNETDTNLSI